MDFLNVRGLRTARISETQRLHSRVPALDTRPTSPANG